MTQLNRTSSATGYSARLDSLPVEVIQAILQYLDVQSLNATSCVSSQLRAAASEQLIWKQLVLSDFTFWDAVHDIRRKKHDSTFHDWKDLYVVRYTANVATHRAIQEMVNDPIDRLSKARRILDHGYGIKDALIRLIRDAPSTDFVLAQKYWAHTVLGCLNRAQALEQWTRIRFRSDVSHPTELALACLDMFILSSSADGDVDDTFRRLNSYVAAVRENHPDIDQQTPRTKAVMVAEFLRRNKWVGIDEGRDYYSIENQFLGLSVRSTHRNSLPLISAVIYCYVCRAFNIRAQPCSYPMHIHAVIQPPLSTDDSAPLDLDNNPLPRNDMSQAETPSNPSASSETPSDLTHLYMDPFNSHTAVSLTSLTQQLSFVAPNASRTQRASYLQPASPRSLLIRSAHNIINSVRATPFDAIRRNISTSTENISIYDAAYAALFSLVMFPSTPHSLAEALEDLRRHYAHHYIEDLRNYENHILPLTAGLGSFGGDRGVSDPLVQIVRKEDHDEKKPKRRAERFKTEEIKFKIGTVFRHRRQNYTAVVYGWDGHCDMEERWIVGNSVDSLPRGRGQPFYNAFVDDQSTRYVAQENIIPLTPEEFTDEDVEKTFSMQIGKWFRRFDATTATFVSNVRDEYPED